MSRGMTSLKAENHKLTVGLALSDIDRYIKDTFGGESIKKTFETIREEIVKRWHMNYVCIKDLVMESGETAAIKGRMYKIIHKGPSWWAFTNEQGNDQHNLSFVDINRWFVEITPVLPIQVEQIKVDILASKIDSLASRVEQLEGPFRGIVI